MNNNQERLRRALAPNNTIFAVPRRDYDKGCSNGRTGNATWINREIPFGHQKRKSIKAKVARTSPRR